MQGAASDERINPEDPEDLARWAASLGVSPYHLLKIIKRVGPVVGDIYYALGLRKWEIPKSPVAGE